ncbi:hypothetical protein N824_08540 [Pedobacter sp. V48]|nr:hypothetical protein N824_08540 [Pedobacter sp. V48]
MSAYSEEVQLFTILSFSAFAEQELAPFTSKAGTGC